MLFRMEKSRVRFLLLIATFFVCCELKAEAPAYTLTLYYEDRIPYSFSPIGEGVIGIVANPINEALDHAGISYSWQLLPFDRQLDALKKNTQAACAVGAFKTPERESYLIFSDPVYQDKPLAIFARPDINFKSYSDITVLLKDKNKTLLIKKSYSYGKIIDALLAQSQTSTKVTNKGNFSMMSSIMNKEADYFFVSRVEIDILIRAMDVNPAKYQLLSLPMMPPGEKRYLACSKKVDDQLIQKINKAITEKKSARTEIKL